GHPAVLSNGRGRLGVIEFTCRHCDGESEMPRPVIGVPTQTLEAIPGELPACWVMGQGYIHVFGSLDVIPWLIPLLPDDLAPLREIYDRLDGLFLTGGVDVDPSKYGEEKQPYCGRTDPARDDVEIQMLRWS